MGYQRITNYLNLLLLIFISSCGTKSIDKPQNEVTKAEKIDELLADYTSYGKFNGSVLVSENGQVIFKKGYGLANMEWDIPNGTETKFRIASVTKQFTGMLILQLTAEGKLDLNEPISTYLPEYPKSNADRITIHHLLTHTSGIPEFDDFVNFNDIERDRHTPQELVDIFAKGDLQFEPGSDFRYSNPGYVVLGLIIETITGKTYGEVLKERIFEPLQMTNSGFDQNIIVLEKRASGYTPNYLRGEFINVNFTDMSIPYAAGSIYSTVEDLYLWDQALNTDQLLSDEYMKKFFGQHVSAYGSRHYAYGWVVGDIRMGNSDESAYTIGHTGGINGFRSQLTRIPERRSSIILLSNLETSRLFDLTIAINGILHDKSYDKNKSVAYTFIEEVKTNGLTRGMDHFNKVKYSDDYYLDLHEMNRAGYELVALERLENAAAVFKLNVELHPDFFGVYDSYGETLLKLGNREEAIANYKKSVELNPQHQEGIRILKELENGE